MTRSLRPKEFAYLVGEGLAIVVFLIAAVEMALRGSVLRWWALAAGLAAGVPLLLAVNSVNRRYFARTGRRPSEATALIPFSVPIGAIGVVLGHARATVEIAALALGASYMATLLFLAVRVVRRRRRR